MQYVSEDSQVSLLWGKNYQEKLHVMFWKQKKIDNGFAI